MKNIAKVLFIFLFTFFLAGWTHLENSASAAPQPNYVKDLPPGHSMHDYLLYLAKDLDAFWSPIMVGDGYADPAATYSFPAPGVPVATNCAVEEPADFPAQAFYCGFDDQIVMTQEMARQLWDGTYRTNYEAPVTFKAGDFSVAFVMAHEYAHNLQTELGWLPVYEEEEPMATSRSLELNADCLAGVWTRSVNDRGLLDASDLNEAKRTLTDLGQDPSDPNPTHGTPQERNKAFLLGYNNGTAPSCDPYLLNPY